MPSGTLTVLGAGSWGTALAILLARHGRPVVLWGRDDAQVAAMTADRCNRRYLPEGPFPDTLHPTNDFDAAVTAADDLLVVVPSRAFRATLEAALPRLREGANVAWATKGLEPASGRLLHEVADEVLGTQRPTAVVSGPTFAREVALGLPTAVTVAARDGAVAEHFAAALHGESFRAYTSDDVIGVGLGGAVKNVLAIAAGIADGFGFGANTRAALITRGLAEISRLGLALGGRSETFMGLAGLGDLVLTCTDDQSRNRRAGLALGRGQTLQQALAAIDQVVEGVTTAAEVHRLAARVGIEMPIAEQVFQVLHQGLSPQAAVEALLARDPKSETG